MLMAAVGMSQVNKGERVAMMIRFDAAVQNVLGDGSFRVLGLLISCGYFLGGSARVGERALSPLP
jgi:hypothetical protein